jgi:WhiB family redox-sensing transcriptional regulator
MTRKHRDNRFFDRAACKGMNPDIFYPDVNSDGKKVWPQEALARKTCANCPVRLECADYALGTEWEEEGYWGSTKKERAKLSALWLQEYA